MEFIVLLSKEYKSKLPNRNKISSLLDFFSLSTTYVAIPFDSVATPFDSVATPFDSVATSFEAFCFLLCTYI